MAGSSSKISSLISAVKKYLTASNSYWTMNRNLPKSYEEDTQVTHTGQKFEKHDRRLLRFIKSQKLVNPNRAIDLIASVPPIECEDSVVFCDGDGPLGHPKVYINLDKPGNHSCGYCGLRFFKKQEHH